MSDSAHPRHAGTALLAAFAAALVAAPAAAQIVPIRTVPVASGDQFLVHPSSRLGMGGVGVALSDTLLDPWIVPGAGARIDGVVVDASPTFYVISDGNGSGRTLPVTVQLGGDAWFGGVSMALQEIRAGDLNGGFGWGAPTRGLDESSALNTFLSAYAGRRLGPSGWSLGAGVSRAGLDAMDGVDILYGGGQRVEQRGSVLDVRVGALREWEAEKSLELVALYHEVDMIHEISGGVWWLGVVDPMPGIDPFPGGPPPMRTEEDETRTWGASATWVQPIGDRGWKLGGTATANRKTHPKIPNYDLMSIPRDPGDTWAGRLGLGLARTAGGTTLGLDLALEPIETETWADAAEPVLQDSVVVVPAGGRTVENDFTFLNSRVRLGGEHAWDRWSIQLGVDVYAVSYDLEQRDFVRQTVRDQRESWLEWTPSWGAALRLPEVEVRYAGRLTTGTGRPGVLGGGFRAGADEALAGGDFIPAPSGDLFLDGAWVLTQRIGVVIPAG
ncbi:MAG: hypothetical protein KY453_10715 [Gemmatimonadetes bacterium]|nr:hypothetical protein [Gemmatimonadota bacterium]